MLLGQVGKAANVSASQRIGSSPLSLAVASRLWIVAARRPARSEPPNNQFFLPTAMGRIVFSTGLCRRPDYAASVFRIDISVGEF